MRQSRYHYQPRPPRSQRHLAPAARVVDAWLGSQELAQALRPHMAKVKWEEVVGPQVAGVTQVESVRDGILFVRVKNSVWANELTLLKDDMLRRLNLALGGYIIRDIHFKGGGLHVVLVPPEKFVPETPSDAELAGVTLSPQARARVETSVQRIADETLRHRIYVSLVRVARLEEWKRRHGWLPCWRCGTLVAPESDSMASESDSLCSLCRAGVK